VLIDKGNVEAIGTVDEMRSSTQPRLRQFLDRVPEPEVAREMDYLQMLTKQSSHSRGATAKRSA
jgi:phospholipid/cholesterol/gamma-HCH transport system ATP-binding protein